MPAPIPNTYQAKSAMGANLIAAMDPWITLHMAWYLDAIGTMFDEVYTLVYDKGTDGEPGFTPGYGALLDPTLCPAADLPYLGQFVGVRVPAGTDAATALALVTAETGQKRGTPAAVKAAITRSITQPWLPGNSYASGAMIYVIDPSGVLAYYQASLGAVTVPTGATFNFNSPPANLIWNPSFEHDSLAGSPAWWVTSATGATLSTHQVQNGWASSGSQSLRMTGSFTGNQSVKAAGPAGTSGIAVVAGTTYTFAVEVNNLNSLSSAATYEVYVNWSDSGGSSTGTSTPVTASIQAAGTIQQLVTTVTAPASTAYAQPVVQVNWNATGTLDFYMDAAQLNQSATLVAYGDGDADPYAWQGTAGNSISGDAWATVDPSTQYTLVERDSPSGLDAYTMMLTVHGSQLTPASDTTALVAALESVKPAGVNVHITLI